MTTTDTGAPEDGPLVPSLGGRQFGMTLRQMAAQVMPGRAIVELGVWLGAGTRELVLGRRGGADAPLIHGYDYFAADDRSLEFARSQGFALERGDDTSQLVRQLLPDTGAGVRFHKGDLGRARWDGGPIGLLVDDANKRPRYFSHVLDVFGPSFIPGETMLALMDFNYWRKWIGSGDEDELRCQYDLVEAHPDWFEPIAAAEPHGTSAQVFRLTERFDHRLASAWAADRWGFPRRPAGRPLSTEQLPPIVDEVDGLFRALSKPPYAALAPFPRSDRSVEHVLRDVLVRAGAEETAHISTTKVRIHEPDRESRGALTRISRTNRPMEPHTDSSYDADPHDLIAFEMRRADGDGGESIVVAAEDAIHGLDAEQRGLLRMPIYPFGNKRFPILSGSEDAPQIRYFRAQIDKGCALGHPLPERALEVMDRLDERLADPRIQWRFRLRAGETLFLSNKYSLHGRTGFDLESDRLMLRYRIRADLLRGLRPPAQ